MRSVLLGFSEETSDFFFFALPSSVSFFVSTSTVKEEKITRQIEIYSEFLLSLKNRIIVYNRVHLPQGDICHKRKCVV